MTKETIELQVKLMSWLEKYIQSVVREEIEHAIETIKGE